LDRLSGDLNDSHVTDRCGIELRKPGQPQSKLISLARVLTNLNG